MRFVREALTVLFLWCVAVGAYAEQPMNCWLDSEAAYSGDTSKFERHLCKVDAGVGYPLYGTIERTASGVNRCRYSYVVNGTITTGTSYVNQVLIVKEDYMRALPTVHPSLRNRHYGMSGIFLSKIIPQCPGNPVSSASSQGGLGNGHALPSSRDSHALTISTTGLARADHEYCPSTGCDEQSMSALQEAIASREDQRLQRICLKTYKDEEEGLESFIFGYPNGSSCVSHKAVYDFPIPTEKTTTVEVKPTPTPTPEACVHPHYLTVDAHVFEFLNHDWMYEDHKRTWGKDLKVFVECLKYSIRKDRSNVCHDGKHCLAGTKLKDNDHPKDKRTGYFKNYCYAKLTPEIAATVNWSDNKCHDTDYK